MQTAKADRGMGSGCDLPREQIACTLPGIYRHSVLPPGAEPVLVVAAFAMKLRQMANVGGASGGIDQVASALGLPPWQVRNARNSPQGWDGSGLGRSIVEVASTDAAVKGASRDPHYALEKMVRIVSLRGKEQLVLQRGDVGECATACPISVSEDFACPASAHWAERSVTNRQIASSPSSNPTSSVMFLSAARKATAIAGCVSL